MRNVLALLLLILAPSPAFADPNAPASRPTATILRPGDVPVGSLGSPLGSYLTLEGHRVDGFKTGVETLLIDTINGKRRDAPIGIWVDNEQLPPPPFRCTVKGYEMARMLGVPPAVEQAAKEAGENIGLPQAGWQVQLYFVALSPVALKDVALKSDPVAAIRSALPEGWTILKVEDNTYPPHRPAGKGKAIFLLPRYGGRVDVVVYIMPSDYQDGEKVPREVKAWTSDRARLIGAAPTFKVYFWEAYGQLLAPGWPTATDDILKALLKRSSSVSQSAPQRPIRQGVPNGQIQ